MKLTEKYNYAYKNLKARLSVYENIFDIVVLHVTRQNTNFYLYYDLSFIFQFALTMINIFVASRSVNEITSIVFCFTMWNSEIKIYIANLMFI